MIKTASWLLALLLLSSCTTSLSLPVREPKSGYAAIKGGTVSIAVISAQYSYVVGVDGTIFKSWSGAKDVRPGKRRFLFAASHAAGLKSYVEMDLTVEAGGRYLIEAANFKGSTVDYRVYRMPERIEIAHATTELIGIPEYRSGRTIHDHFRAMGWRDE